jgi:thiamine biosynthesis lipoprotein
MSRKILYAVLATTISLVFAVFLNGCGQRAFKQSRLLMGTLVEVTVVSRDQVQANKAIETAFQEMSRIEHLLSIYQKESPISMINNLAGDQTVMVGSEVFQILKEAIGYGKLTSGAFDLSIGPLTSLWNFGQGHLPSKDEIAPKLLLVDYRDVILNEGGGVRFGGAGMAIDLGGIAKGYAVDRAIEVLKANGISRAMVNAGGDIRGIGRIWRIGIQHPRETNSILGIIRLKDEAVATSGDYQRYFIKDGVRYHHIIDPRTGWPAMGCMSVSIIAKEAAMADALATGCFVLGPKLGMELIESLPQVEGIIVTSEGKGLTSSGLAKIWRFHSLR